MTKSKKQIRANAVEWLESLKGKDPSIWLVLDELTGIGECSNCLSDVKLDALIDLLTDDETPAMADSNATELNKLCKLLDERGIEWTKGDAAYQVEWTNANGQHCSAMWWKPTLTVLMSGCTPEQAVAATLGHGECENDRLKSSVKKEGVISFN